MEPRRWRDHHWRWAPTQHYDQETVGGWGSKSNGTASYVARCRFRDYDGVTRSPGPSKTAASRVLQDEIRARTGSPAAPLRPHHTFERAAQRWLENPRLARGAVVDLAHFA